MSIFKGYEIKVLHLLASGVLSPGDLEAVVREGQFADYKYTGGGYFLSVRHVSLPGERAVCHEPSMSGNADGVTRGFVIFIGESQLTLECHSWGELRSPKISEKEMFKSP